MISYGSTMNLFFLSDIDGVTPPIFTVTTMGDDDVQRIVLQNLSSSKWKYANMFTCKCASLTSLNEYGPTQSERGGHIDFLSMYSVAPTPCIIVWYKIYCNTNMHGTNFGSGWGALVSMYTLIYVPYSRRCLGKGWNL
jgi:hypothetical protein